MGFVAPALLLALLILPVVWWFIRHLPPSPKRVDFPALALLRPLAETQPPPRTPPLWLLILRLLMVTVLITLLAEPFLNKGDAPTYQNAPFVLVIDNGWRAAPQWEKMQTVARTVLEAAQAQHQKVLLLPTAETQPIVLTNAQEAQENFNRLKPQPWPANPTTVLQTASTVLQAADAKTSNVIWLTSGLTDNTQTLEETLRLLGSMGQAQVYLPTSDALPTMITTAKPTENGLTLKLWHPTHTPFNAVSLYDLDGRFITRGLPIEETEQATRQEQQINLKIPSTLKGAGVLKIDGQSHLGAWHGLNQIRGIPRIGLMTEPNLDFPLLSGTYYLENALSPLGTPRLMTADTALDGFNMILLDHQPSDPAALQHWVQQGGVLVTFAGAWLENNRDVDTLLPVRLRPRPRELAGPLSWNGALKLGAARPDTPLQDLTLPDDVHVTTQFLPENTPDMNTYTWLALEDDTPLITGRKEGNGYTVLVHVSADVRWSSLPLSGFYLDVLSTLVNLARGEVDTHPVYPLPPLKLVDAYGNPRPVPDSLTVLQEGAIVSRDAPVGFYGPAGTPMAHNLNIPQLRSRPIGQDDLKGLNVSTYQNSAARIPLQPMLGLILMLLLVIDTLARRWDAIMRLLGKAVGIAVLVLSSSLFAPPSLAQIQGIPPLQLTQPQDAAFASQLAWIPSKNTQVDALTQAGLTTLSTLLRFRTTIETAAPKELNLETDDLGYYPLIYWAVVPNPPPLSATAVRHLQDYLQQGGLLVLDNQTELGYAGAATEAILNMIVKRPLTELRDTHVLGRTYYLMRGQYPGRVTGKPVWIENTNGVASVIVGSHDWAAGWAVDAQGKPMRPAIPGGETQRALALRFGVNLVMYALMGDYKADQLHIDALLNRMQEDGQ